MAIRNNGRSFEKLVAVIHEAYKDSPHTKIYISHKLKDKLPEGKKREFDVIIKTKVNGLVFTVAIECKDYKNPVPLEKVEAFSNKCSTINGINKKILISPNGFQSGTIENASHFDVELYNLEDIKPENFLPWFELDSIGNVYIGKSLITFDVVVENDVFGTLKIAEKHLDGATLLISPSDPPQHPLQYIDKTFFNGGIQPRELSLLLEESVKRGVKNFEQPVDLETWLNAWPQEKNYLIHNSKKLLIKCIFLNYKFSLLQKKHLQIL